MLISNLTKIRIRDYLLILTQHFTFCFGSSEGVSMECCFHPDIVLISFYSDVTVHVNEVRAIIA